MKNAVIFLIIVFSFQSCRNNEPLNKMQIPDESYITDALIKVNSYLVKRNQQHIRNFIKRTGWEMNETRNGIWMEILEKNSIQKCVDNDQVEIRYSIQLLSGKMITEPGNDIQKMVTLGRSSIESGLDYALRNMGKGDSARLIIPPYLAFGNFGDSGKIPPDAILIYYLKIIK